jgi:H+/Cl- antiporter ClcA
MNKSLLEESVLFISVLKWVILATGIGIAVGLSTTVFLKILDFSVSRIQVSPHFFLLLPAGLFISAIAVKYFSPDAKGYGTEKVIEAVHKHSGKMSAIVAPVKLFATIVTTATGGSVGQVGPCAQIGGALSSLFADILKFDANDRKKLVICGISAGFASVLGAPIAGAIFGVEVLFIGSILYEVLLPSFISGMIGYQISSYFGINYFQYHQDFIPAFSEAFFLKVVLAGIFFGVCAAVLIEILKSIDKLAGRINLWAPLKSLAGGALLAGLTFLTSTNYLGLGLETIKIAISGAKIVPHAFLMKAIFTGITFGSGGSGGIITPILFMGAVAGSVFGDFWELNRGTFAAIGMVSVLAGAANTPIAASILAMELFGLEIAPYAAVACVVSFLMTGHRSVFPTQIMGLQKSSSVHVELGNEVETAETHYEPRERSLIGICLRLYDRIKNRKRVG